MVFRYLFLGETSMKQHLQRISQRFHISLVIALVGRHWPIGVGLIAALFAFFATQRYAADQVAAERDRMLPRGGLVEVLVAARDLQAGDKASAETIAVRKIPVEWALPNALSPIDFDSVHHIPLAVAVKAGHPLALEHLRKQTDLGAALKLEPGYRAVSISVDEVSSVGGLIQPGDRIDLWAATVTSPSDSQGDLVRISSDSQPGSSHRARMVAQNLRVMATGQRTQRIDSQGSNTPIDGYSSMTLAVPASVAEIVLGGQFQGRLGIALRSEEGQAKPDPRSRSKPVVPKVAPVEILIGGMNGVMQ
jgi:pilus assembly protein CpaB